MRCKNAKAGEDARSHGSTAGTRLLRASQRAPVDADDSSVPAEAGERLARIDDLLFLVVSRPEAPIHAALMPGDPALMSFSSASIVPET